MYEIHQFPDGSRVFSRGENRYVPTDDPGFVAWRDLKVYLFDTVEQEQQVETVDEQGNPITITITVPVQVPRMVEVPVYNEFGEQIGTEEVQAYEQPNLTPRVIGGAAFSGTYDLPSPPSVEERLTAAENLLMELMS